VAYIMNIAWSRMLHNGLEYFRITTAIVPREGGNHGAISGEFCAEKVPKRYMFGTHLALNI